MASRLPEILAPPAGVLSPRCRARRLARSLGSISTAMLRAWMSRFIDPCQVIDIGRRKRCGAPVRFPVRTGRVCLQEYSKDGVGIALQVLRSAADRTAVDWALSHPPVLLVAHRKRPEELRERPACLGKPNGVAPADAVERPAARVDVGPLGGHCRCARRPWAGR